MTRISTWRRGAAWTLLVAVAAATPTRGDASDWFGVLSDLSIATDSAGDPAPPAAPAPLASAPDLSGVLADVSITTDTAAATLPPTAEPAPRASYPMTANSAAEGVPDLANILAAPVAEPIPVAVRNEFVVATDARAPVDYPILSAEVITPPAITDQRDAEAITPPAPFAPPTEPSGVAVLSQPLVTVSIDASPAWDVAKNSENIKPENRIQDLAAGRFATGGAVVDAVGAFERFPARGFAWASPASYHRPLLFEQPNLERYGHYAACCRRDSLTQSAISAAHFFGAVPAIPYWIGAYGCCEPTYVLGAYRPGSCNPHRPIDPRCSWRGLALQAAASTGAVFVVP